MNEDSFMCTTNVLAARPMQYCLGSVHASDRRIDEVVQSR
jgi:hypothetical protein